MHLDRSKRLRLINGVKFDTVAAEHEVDLTGGAVSMFCDTDFDQTLARIQEVVTSIISVDKHDHIGILLNSAGLSQIRKNWLLIASLLHGTG